MPIYEYECRACGHIFEEWQKITERPVKTCPNCRKRRVERLVSATSFTLKGSGWYATDYCNRSTGSSAKQDGGSSGTSESKPSDASKKKEGKKGSSAAAAAA
jgi:putative FmdB family regulatory protein